jgi:16S rRNA (uracil1498-N3)-methyltransferase
MQLFYTTAIHDGFARFDEEETRHLLTVLRYKPGQALRLTDGKGHFYEAELSEGSKKQALARIISTETPPVSHEGRLHLAIAPTKQIERFEWFLEKATEIGLHSITPLVCQRSERDSIRPDRLEKVLVSAMKQSLHAWLPQLKPLTPFVKLIKESGETSKFIAWCGDVPPAHLKDVLKSGTDALILIGPEGDFSPAEVSLALANGFQEISLGPSRLRTETAGVYAAVVFQLASAHL